MRIVLVFTMLLTAALANAAASPPNILNLPSWVNEVAISRVGDGRPDLRARRAAFRHLAHGRYSAAMRSFEQASLYADKASQAMIAFMFAEGLGVERDPVTALAWMEVASERDYPVLVDERVALDRGMRSDERAEAARLARELRDEHGDVVAKQRLADAMAMRLLPRGAPHVTGSRVGNIANIRNGSPNAEGKVVLDVGGGLHRKDVLVPRRWDASRYWTSQDRLWERLQVNS